MRTLRVCLQRDKRRNKGFLHKKNGWTIIVPPKGFFVKGKNGPLKEGELERAVDWAKEIV